MTCNTIIRETKQTLKSLDWRALGLFNTKLRQIRDGSYVIEAMFYFDLHVSHKLTNKNITYSSDLFIAVIG